MECACIRRNLFDFEGLPMGRSTGDTSMGWEVKFNVKCSAVEAKSCHSAGTLTGWRNSANDVLARADEVFE